MNFASRLEDDFLQPLNKTWPAGYKEKKEGVKEGQRWGKIRQVFPHKISPGLGYFLWETAIQL